MVLKKIIALLISTLPLSHKTIPPKPEQSRPINIILQEMAINTHISSWCIENLINEFFKDDPTPLRLTHNIDKDALTAKAKEIFTNHSNKEYLKILVELENEWKRLNKETKEIFAKNNDIRLNNLQEYNILSSKHDTNRSFILLNQLNKNATLSLTYASSFKNTENATDSLPGKTKYLLDTDIQKINTAIQKIKNEKTKIAEELEKLDIEWPKLYSITLKEIRKRKHPEHEQIFIDIVRSRAEVFGFLKLNSVT